jgi:hypothetical protein
MALQYMGYPNPQGWQDYLDEEFFQLSALSGANPSNPASAYSPNALDYLDQLDQARLQQAMMPNLPKTLDSDPASMIERQFRQYRDKRQREAIPTNRSAETRGARPPANYDPLSSVQTRPRPVQPITPPSMGAPPSTGNVPMPARTQTSAAQTTGLLDTEEPAEGGSFYDDPMRMGLLQAGLGLMSAPQYSTNPNDVTLGSALAKGLGGFIQGYGGTKKRLSEAERQKLDDDFKRQQMEKDFEYKDALIQMYGIQGEAQRKNAELNATEKQLQKQAIAAQVERILKHEGKLGNATRRLELNRLGTSDNTNQQNLFADLYRESITDRTPMEETLVASGKYTEEEAKKLRFTTLETQYNKILDLQTNPPNPVSAPSLDDGEMYRRLEQGRRDPTFVETPEYAEAYGRYKNKALKPSLSQSGTATYIPRSDYPAPEGMEAQTTTSALSKVTQTPGGTQINQMNPDDSKEVRTLFSNIQKLEEFENIVQNVDLNNMDRITSDSPEVARLSTIYNDLLLRLKEQPYNLGVITGPDMDLMESILDNPAKADPTNIRAFFRDKDYYLAKINQLRGILINDTQNVLQDYGGDVNQAYEQRFQRPLTWVPTTPPKTSRTSPKTKEILSQVEQPPAVTPVPNNGNESSLMDFLPDPIQNIFR